MTLLLLLESMLWTRLWYVAHRICLCPAHLCGVLNKTIISILPLSVFPVPTRVSAHNRSLISRCWINDSMFSYMCITGGSQSCVPWPYPHRLTLHVEAVLWHISCPPRFRASFCHHCREQTWSSGGADASPRVALCQWQTRVEGCVFQPPCPLMGSSEACSMLCPGVSQQMELQFFEVINCLWI